MENKDIKKLTKLAEQGDAAAIRELAELYYDGKEYGKALDLYLKLADQNDAEGVRRIGCCYYSQNDYKKAVECWLKAANLGNARAQRNMGNCYCFGEGVAQDYKKAVEWYTKAAEQGDAPAQCNLGYCYDKGKGVGQDPKKAVELYTKAAEQGNAVAQRNLGICYINGTGVERDYKKAVELYIKAAELGDVIAQRNLGGCYKDGTGVERNYDTAEYWYKKSAEQGDEEAKKALNDLYEKGLVIPADAPRCHDADFGELVYAGKKGWKGQTTANFNGKETELAIELEGTKDDKVTDAQRKAYAEYKEKECDFFKAMIAKAKQTYKAANAETDNEILPTKLYIDRDGNYGWACDTAWCQYGKSVILSDGDVQLTSDSILYNYAEVIANRTKKEWYVDDIAYMSIFGELQELSVLRASYEFEDDDVDEEISEGKLTDREVELLMWLTTEFNTADIANDVLEYCNNSYEGWNDIYGYDYPPIEADELLDELAISKIYLKTQRAAESKRVPEISLAGECGCDEEHGIAICFRDKKLFEIGSEHFGF
ncbi:MAG: sel1 repeat family protein [Paludibacteraceae bacterium]|nr:sel1 repeat family protein [Paludibacteraceae bacterium]